MEFTIFLRYCLSIIFKGWYWHNLIFITFLCKVENKRSWMALSINYQQNILITICVKRGKFVKAVNSTGLIRNTLISLGYNPFLIETYLQYNVYSLINHDCVKKYQIVTWIVVWRILKIQTCLEAPDISIYYLLHIFSIRHDGYVVFMDISNGNLEG